MDYGTREKRICQANFQSGPFPIFICDTGLPQYLLQQAYVDLSVAVRIGNANFLPSLYHELMLSTRKWA